MKVVRVPIAVKNNDGKIVKDYVNAKVSGSFVAEMRWQENFPAQAEKESLYAYTARIQANHEAQEKKKKEAKENGIDYQYNDNIFTLSILKVVHCIAEIPSINSYYNLMEMIQIMPEKIQTEFFSKIGEMLQLMSQSIATAKN